ncbi:MAG: SIS domain-containing protein [Planctomycetes bacterium]|nr:SIS domain-containing protein [Planctomycetota bacterium]
MKAARQIIESIENSGRVILSLRDQAATIEKISGVVIDALKRGNKIMTAGNGGSAADALHMSEELVGRFKSNRRSLPGVSLVADPTLITCIANDYGYERLFSRQVEGLGQKGDVLVFFTTSGNGAMFQHAVEAAKAKGVLTAALLGKGGGPLAGKCDHELIVADSETARIQEAHTLVMHIILEAVEREFA